MGQLSPYTCKAQQFLYGNLLYLPPNTWQVFFLIYHTTKWASCRHIPAKFNNFCTVLSLKRKSAQQGRLKLG
jgi:hypothetical protein